MTPVGAPHEVRCDPGMLRRQVDEVRLDFTHEGAALRVHCRFLEQGISRRTRIARFNHPAPPFCRLFLFRKGGGRLRVRQGLHRLRPGIFYLLPASWPFVVTYDPAELIWFHLHIHDQSGLSLFDHETGLQQVRDSELARAIWRQDKAQASIACRMLVMHVLTRFIQRGLDELVRRTGRTRRFHVLLDWIRTEPPATLTVEALAGRMHLSRSTLSRAFRQTMGVPLKRYIQDVGLRKAQELLIYEDLTVEQIAYALGYQDPAYFHRVFRRQIGQTPAAFRRGGLRGS